MAAKVWKGVYPLVFGHSCQLLLKRFFDQSTPSLRKVNNGEEKNRSCQDCMEAVGGVGIGPFFFIILIFLTRA